jgi:hypothetical protein
MIRLSKMVVACAALLAGVSASAQPPEIPPRIRDLLPEGAIIADAYECPDPSPASSEPECCRVTVEVSAEGKAVSASAVCSHPGYVAAEIQCEMGRPQEPRIRTGGVREGYTTSFNRTHLPYLPRSAEEFRAMGDQADAKCDKLDVP